MASNTNARRFSKPRQQRTDEFDQVIVDIARVTRVMAGGKRMRFRACVLVGDRKGRVGTAVAKGADVTLAINKAATKARKQVVTVPVVHDTIPHRVDYKFGAARVMIKPAPKGTGVIAGGAMRLVFDLAGISNVVAKSLGSKNKLNNVRATIEALKHLKRVEVKQPVGQKKQPKADGPKPHLAATAEKQP